MVLTSGAVALTNEPMKTKLPPRLHILGRKNHGKTTLVVDLVQVLTRRGRRVATIKHTHHEHELDTPGKDSHRHREAGAAAVGILSQTMNAVFWPPDPEASREDLYHQFASIMADCDLLLVEGDTQTSGPKVEVWRAERGTPPLAEIDPSLLAVISDEQPNVACRVLARGDIDAIADWIEAQFFRS